MKFKYLVAILGFNIGIILNGNAQVLGQNELHLLTPMNKKLKETSGLTKIGESFWTHNDGEDGPFLYQVNIENGKVLKRVKVTNAKNKDWEDICVDDDFVYVADIGNNQRKQKKYKIYIIPKTDLLKANKKVKAPFCIEYEYEDGKPQNSESIVSVDKQLLIFTKSARGFTNVFTLKKTSYKQKAIKIGQLNSFGQVSGGFYDAEKNEIILTGYQKLTEQLYRAFLLNIREVNSVVSEWKPELIDLNIGAQIEGITMMNPSQYLLSAEGTKLSAPRLFTLPR